MFASALQALKSLARGGRLPEESPPPDAHTFTCPICDAPMTVRGEELIEEPPVRVRDLECDGCGMVCDRIYDPERGYDRRIVL